MDEGYLIRERYTRERSSHVQRGSLGNFVEALWTLEEEEDVEPLIQLPHRGLRGGQRLGLGDVQRARRLPGVLEGVQQDLLIDCLILNSPCSDSTPG